MPTTEQKILDEVMATGIASRARCDGAMTDDITESMADALLGLGKPRLRLVTGDGHPDRALESRREPRGAFREVAVLSFAGLAAIDSYLAAGSFGTIDELARSASAAVRRAAEGGDLPRSVERFTLDEAAETCVSLLTLAWGTYLVGYRGGQARLEEMQLQLMDALILAVLAIRLIDAG